MAPAEMMATAAASKVEAAGRMSSMEWEPRTLTLDQIKYAREAALYVVSTKTQEEAIRIFTEGLKPVQVVTVRKCSMDSSDDDIDLDSSDDSTAGCGGGSKGRGGHRGRRFVERDIVTAPF